MLGWSKRVAERLTASFDGHGAGRYVSVRFGNVLGSRGSVVPAFMEQISRGGPVTVTHPDVERFFMLIPEACQLVLQAGAIGRGGEVMVLDMGSPVKIVEVARTLIDLSGRTDIEIVYTGLRPGEKLTEELFTPGEEIERSAHPLISQVTCRPSTPATSTSTSGLERHRDPRVDAPPRERRALERRLMTRAASTSPSPTSPSSRSSFVLEALRSGWVAPLGPDGRPLRGARSPSASAWPARSPCRRAPPRCTSPCWTSAPRPGTSSSSRR